MPWAAIGGHVDVPRLVEGGFGAQFFGLVSLPIGQRSGLAAVIDEQIDALDLAVAQRPDRLVKVRTAADIRAAKARGAVGALLGIEGAHALEGDADKLDHFAAAACATWASPTSAPTRPPSPPTAAAAATTRA